MQQINQYATNGKIILSDVIEELLEINYVKMKPYKYDHNLDHHHDHDPNLQEDEYENGAIKANGEEEDYGSPNKNA